MSQNTELCVICEYSVLGFATLNNLHSGYVI